MAARTRRTYLTNDQIYDQWKIYKQTETITDTLATYMHTIASRIANGSRFRGYPQDMKDDMIGDAILKQIKNLKNMKESRKDSFFNYLTLCCICSFYSTLGKHYKHNNLIAKLKQKYVNDFNIDNKTNISMNFFEDRT